MNLDMTLPKLLTSIKFEQDVVQAFRTSYIRPDSVWEHVVPTCPGMLFLVVKYGAIASVKEVFQIQRIFD